MLKEDEKFDLKIRSILEEGREEVPDLVWDAVCRKLDEASASGIAAHTNTRKRLIPLWVRYSAAGLAAAAAVAVAVIFSWTPDHTGRPGDIHEGTIAVVKTPEQESGSPDRIMTAQAKEAAARKNESAGTHVPDAVTHAEDLYLTPDPEVSRDTASASGAAQDTVKENGTDTVRNSGGKNDGEGRNENMPSESGKKENDLDEMTGDPFDDFGEDTGEKERRKVKTAISVFGNAVSNSNSERSSNSSMMHSPGSVTTSGIRETGEEGSRYGIPLSFGAGIKLIFTPKWSMSVGLNYTFLSRTFDGIYVDAEQTPARISRYEDIRNVQNYIGIPVNFYYSIVSKDFIDFYTYAGGTAEYCLTNRYSAENEDGPLYFKDKAGSMQFSANIGIGVEFNITDYMGIYIDPSLRYYFRNSNAPKSIRTAQPLMLGFEAGLRFRL